MQYPESPWTYWFLMVKCAALAVLRASPKHGNSWDQLASALIRNGVTLLLWELGEFIWVTPNLFFCQQIFSYSFDPGSPSLPHTKMKKQEYALVPAVPEAGKPCPSALILVERGIPEHTNQEQCKAILSNPCFFLCCLGLLINVS